MTPPRARERCLRHSQLHSLSPPFVLSVRVLGSSPATRRLLPVARHSHPSVRGTHCTMTFGGSSLAQGIVAPKVEKCTGLPLVACPKCGEEIMELTCGSGSKAPGAMFFKCRLHERDVSPKVLPSLYLQLSPHFDLVEPSNINCMCLERA
jgi:hypothetical protein